MVKFWAKRINFDISRINEVPLKWREDVRAYITEQTEGN